MTRSHFFLAILSCIPFVGRYFKDSLDNIPNSPPTFDEARCTSKVYNRAVSELYEVCLRKALKNGAVSLIMRYKTPDDIYHVDTFLVPSDNIKEKDVAEIHNSIKKEFIHDPFG